MDQPSSQELWKLIKEAQNGSEEAFQEIFERLSNKFFAYAFSRTSNRDDALDIVQETFIELWQALNRFQYRSNESFYGFVFTITKRKLSRYYKSKRVIPLDQINPGKSYEMRQEDYRYLLKQMNGLTANYQDVLTLRYWSDMTFGEIAAALNIKETTAKVWHYRALKQLKINLDKDEYIF